MKVSRKAENGPSDRSPFKSWGFAVEMGALSNQYRSTPSSKVSVAQECFRVSVGTYKETVSSPGPVLFLC